ncbi:MAG: hypothetical protein V3V08_12220 [Nannocystaceae bacterium]
MLALVVRPGYDKALLAKVMTALGTRLEQEIRRRLKAIKAICQLESR